MLRKEEILERTSNGLAIFKHYLPGNWRIGRNFLNPLYEDSKASCNIYFDRRSSICLIRSNKENIDNLITNHQLYAKERGNLRKNK